MPSETNVTTSQSESGGKKEEETEPEDKDAAEQDTKDEKIVKDAVDEGTAAEAEEPTTEAPEEIIDLKQKAADVINEVEQITYEEDDHFDDGPGEIRNPYTMKQIILDFQGRGDQYQNVVFMLRRALKKDLSPPVRVFVDTWPEYTVVNIFRDRSSPTSDDQSFVVYRDASRMTDVLTHVNLRHIYGRMDREIVMKGIREQDFAEFRTRMARAGFQLYDFSTPYKIMSLQVGDKLNNRPLQPFLKRAELTTTSPFLQQIADRYLGVGKDQIANYVTSYPHCAIVNKQRGDLVAHGFVNDTGALDLIYVLPNYRGKGIGSHLVVELVISLRAGGWLDTPFVQMSQDDYDAIEFFQHLGFQESSTVRRRLLRIKRWARAAPCPAPDMSVSYIEEQGANRTPTPKATPTNAK